MPSIGWMFCCEQRGISRLSKQADVWNFLVVKAPGFPVPDTREALQVGNYLGTDSQSLA